MGTVIENALLKYATSDNVNPQHPTSKGLCLYTDRDDPNRHCLAGQIWVDFGGDPSVLQESLGIMSIFAFDRYNEADGLECGVESFVSDVIPGITYDDVKLLSEAQQLADGFSLEVFDKHIGINFDLAKGLHRVPRPWKEVVAFLRDAYDFSEDTSPI